MAVAGSNELMFDIDIEGVGMVLKITHRIDRPLGNKMLKWITGICNMSKREVAAIRGPTGLQCGPETTPRQAHLHLGPLSVTTLPLLEVVFNDVDSLSIGWSCEEPLGGLIDRIGGGPWIVVSIQRADGEELGRDSVMGVEFQNGPLYVVTQRRPPAMGA